MAYEMVKPTYLILSDKMYSVIQKDGLDFVSLVLHCNHFAVN